MSYRTSMPGINVTLGVNSPRNLTEFDLNSKSRIDVLIQRIVNYGVPLMLEHHLLYNDAFTRAQITQSAQTFMLYLYDANEVKTFQVDCSEENNPPSIIDANNLVLDISFEDTDHKVFFLRFKFDQPEPRA